MDGTGGRLNVITRETTYTLNPDGMVYHHYNDHNHHHPNLMPHQIGVDMQALHGYRSTPPSPNGHHHHPMGAPRNTHFARGGRGGGVRAGRGGEGRGEPSRYMVAVGNGFTGQFSRGTARPVTRATVGTIGGCTERGGPIRRADESADCCCAAAGSSRGGSTVTATEAVEERLTPRPSNRAIHIHRDAAVERVPCRSASLLTVVNSGYRWEECYKANGKRFWRHKETGAVSKIDPYY